VTTENGCTQEQVFDVLEDFDLIEINSPDSLINCYIPEINLSVNLSPSDFASIEWNGPSGFISSELEPQINEGGLYVLTVEGNNGCTNTTEVQINSDFAQPIIELNDGILSCNQTSVTITNEQDNDYFYLWESNGTDLSSETGKEIIALQAGTYFTTATNLDNGCETTSESIVEQLPDISNIEIETDNPDCFNPFGNIEITGIIGGTEPYAFSIDGGITYQSETVFTDLNSGEYSVVVQDFYECADSLDAEIVSLLDFELSANGPFVIFAGTSQQLIVETGIIPENIESITWSPNESLSCTDCLNPVSNTLEDVTYMVTVIDKDGCIYQAEIEIRILENPIYIPNVFTPNDDGENEYFSVFGDLEKIQNVNIFSIYDRWGERVFKTENVLATDESMKWYGNFKGQPALTGVYAYYIEYISITGELIKRTGDVTIIR
jgi:gliding motility-associated-like protein